MILLKRPQNQKRAVSVILIKITKTDISLRSKSSTMRNLTSLIWKDLFRERYTLESNI
jgi:hypothetical protein